MDEIIEHIRNIGLFRRINKRFMLLMAEVSAVS